MQQIDIDGVAVHYQTRGEGFPILLIHGFMPDHRLMTGCMEPIFERRPGWQRFYPDLPGMGRTPGSDAITSTDDMLRIVVAFIDRVIGDRPFAVVGQSYGGYLARGIVARRAAQVAGVALLCPVSIAVRDQRTVPPFTVLARDPALLASLAATAPVADVEEFQSMAVVQSPATWERFRDEVVPGLQVADQRFLQRIEARYGLSFDVDDLPRPFERPSLLLLGRQDQVVGYHDAWPILARYPRATFAVLDRAGHNLQFEQPALFDGLMTEWLDRVADDMSRGS